MVVDLSNVIEIGFDSLDNNGNIGKLGLRWLLLCNFDIKGEFFGLCRVLVLKYLFFLLEVEVIKLELDVMVVFMLFLYISVKDII